MLVIGDEEEEEEEEEEESMTVYKAGAPLVRASTLNPKP